MAHRVSGETDDRCIERSDTIEFGERVIELRRRLVDRLDRPRSRVSHP